MLEKMIRRYKVMDTHRELVKTGKYLEAKYILRLLREGSVTLRLSDLDFEVECICEKLGCSIYYDRRGYYSRVHL